MVVGADVQDRSFARLLLSGIKARFPRLEKILADGGFESADMARWLVLTERCFLWISKRTDQIKAFIVQPKRWIVERTFAWLGNSRRLSKDYEGDPKTSEFIICLTMTRLMLKRLENKK
jgi:transposase